MMQMMGIHVIHVSICVFSALLISTGCVIYMIRTQHTLQLAFTLTAITPIFTITIAILAALYKKYYS